MCYLKELITANAKISAALITLVEELGNDRESMRKSSHELRKVTQKMRKWKHRSERTLRKKMRDVKRSMRQHANKIKYLCSKAGHAVRDFKATICLIRLKLQKKNYAFKMVNEKLSNNLERMTL